MATTKKLLGSVLKVNENVISRRNSDNTFSIISIDNEENYFSLDGVAAEFWSMIDGKNSVQNISKKLFSKYDYSAKDFNASVEKLLKDLLKSKLIEA